MADLSGLTKFTKPASESYVKGFLYSQDISNYEIQKNIQYKRKLRYVTSDVTLQGSGCDLTYGTNGTWTNKEIEVAVIQTATKYCADDFREYALPATEAIRDMYLLEQADLKKQKDTMLWQGDTTTTGSTDKFNGFKYHIDLASDTLASGFGSTALSATNIDDAIDAMVTKYYTSESLMARGVVAIHMPYASFALYKANRLSANYYHDKVNQINPNTSWLFGYEGLIKVVAEVGLLSVDDMYLTWDKNFVVGMDEVERKTEFKIMVDEVKELVYMKSYTSLGTQIKFTNEIVTLRG